MIGLAFAMLAGVYGLVMWWVIFEKHKRFDEEGRRIDNKK